MPEILRSLGFIFFFFSNEHLPVHIHIKGKGGFARYELEPEIRLTDTKGLTKKDLKKIEKIIADQKGYFVAEWHAYFKKR